MHAFNELKYYNLGLTKYDCFLTLAVRIGFSPAPLRQLKNNECNIQGLRNPSILRNNIFLGKDLYPYIHDTSIWWRSYGAELHFIKLS